MAGAPAFQLISGTQVVIPDGPVEDEGLYGTSAYGTTTYGVGVQELPGGEIVLDMTPYAVPTLAPGSDHLTVKRRPVVGEIVHRRGEIIVGARTFATRYRWHCVWNLLTEAEVEALMVFFLARKFYLLPYGSPETGRWVVRWAQADFGAETIPRCPGYYNLVADLDEVPA